MEYPPNLVTHAEGGGPAASLPGRRLQYRQRISTLAYLNLDHGNGGIIRDLSEAGLAIQAVSPLGLNQPVYLRFDLLRPRLRVETPARVCWADSRGQAGLEFLNLPQHSRRLLKQWIFMQLLARAYQAAQLGLIFVPDQPAEGAAELLFSPAPRPAIRLEPNPADRTTWSLAERAQSVPAGVSWLGSCHLLARIADGLLLLVAVLLFCVLAVNITHSFPDWPVMLALACPVTCLFALLYWFLFSFWIGVTPGTHLVRLLRPQSAGETHGEDRPRFR